MILTLPGGYKMKLDREHNQVIIGSTTVNVSGPLDDAEKAIRNVFAMGMAAKQSHITKAFNLFWESMNEVVIIEGEEP